MGDNTKGFIKLSHQDGARQERFTHGHGECKQNHESLHKSENQASYPKVQ